MKKPLREVAQTAYEYLDGIGEQIFFIGGHDAVARLNAVMGELRESLDENTRYTPCRCVSPARCDAYDRCCKND